MSVIEAKERQILFQMPEETVLIEPYGEDCVRVRATRNSVISDERWTLLPPEADEARVRCEGDRAFLENGKISAELFKVWGGYRLVFYKNGKEILRTREEGDAARRYSSVEGDFYQIKTIFEANDGEHIYGIGQEQQSCFDRKGGAYELVHYNTKSSLPVIYSSLGYGFIWNSPAVGRCEFTKNHTLWQSDSAYQADYLVFVGDTPAETMNKYCRLTGFAPKLPSWAAGFWQCKLRYESQDDLLAVAREYKRRGVPINAIVIDYFHWTEQGEWKFEPSLWPDPEGMCRELREMGIRPVVSIWPTINPRSRNWAHMNDRNMLIRTKSGQYGIFDFYGPQTHADFTNPEARKFVWEQVKNNYYDKGVKTYWLDEAEPEIHPANFKNLIFHVGGGAQTALLYPYYYSKAFYDGLKEEGETETVSLTRAAYPGSQKFGALVWNGDIPSTFEALYQSVISGLSMSMCGIPWWNSDIGGFGGGDIESDYFRELIVRWFQFGVFCPVMRLHGARKKTEGQIDRHPGVKETSGGDNEIWSFGKENYPILKSLIELRYRLKPYITEHMRAASETGTPLMRPMFFDFYDDEVCYGLEDQYMFGPDILFAPIYRRGETERKVYLPRGKWVRTLDKTVCEGGKFVDCRAQIHEFIAFVREGAAVLTEF